MKSTYLIADTLANLNGSHIALFTGDPTSTPELSKTGYARQPSGFPASPSNPAELPGDVIFGPATESWGNITHVALFDASTGGNMLWLGTLDAAKTIDLGDELKLPAGTGLTVTES